MENLKRFLFKIVFQDTPERIPESIDINENDKCCICLDFISPTLQRSVTILSCRHFFHKKCISNWTNSSGLFCPLCQNELEGSTSMDSIQSINTQNFLPFTPIIPIPTSSSMAPNRSTTARRNRSTTTPTTTPARSTTTPVRFTTTPARSTTTPVRSTARLTITSELTMATAPILSLLIAAMSPTSSASPTSSMAS
ncbi:25920_t:CDS:1, partial [Dentiscutata erythropus]